LSSSAPVSWWRLRAHFFAVYSVLGCVSPYLPVYLRDVKGIGPGALGIILATGQAGVLFMPALMTFLADRYRVVAPLLVALFALNAVAVGLLTQAQGFLACLACIFFTQLANQPQIALADGLFFSLQADPRAPRIAYAGIRVWGTLGFIAANLLVAAVFPLGGLAAMPWVAAALALAGLLNATRLPRRLGPVAPAARARFPTAEAARVLAQPRVALLCLGLALMVVTNTAYYGFYPLYLTEQVGVAPRWVGAIAALGVTLEIGYMLNLDRLRARLGLPGLILLGAACSLARLTLLAFFPTAPFAIGLQALHGLTIIGVLIAPAMYLNQLAPDHCRNSVQGLYVMLVVGAFAILGNLLSGRIAEHGLLTLYRAALAIGLLGFTLIALSFRPAPPLRNSLHIT
jgi:PPP family 3-phenylpropionic acid transporter